MAYGARPLWERRGIPLAGSTPAPSALIAPAMDDHLPPSLVVAVARLNPPISEIGGFRTIRRRRRDSNPRTRICNPLPIYLSATSPDGSPVVER